MLSNLLPGLRELRAPFAAGVLWLLAIWVRWEPLLPTPEDAKKTPGIANSFYRLHELVPDVALGATAGFSYISLAPSQSHSSRTRCGPFSVCPFPGMIAGSTR